MAVQTPKQRAANDKFYKAQERKMGKPKKVANKSSAPVSRTWVWVLVFLLIGGGVLELLRLFF